MEPTYFIPHRVPQFLDTPLTVHTMLYFLSNLVKIVLRSYAKEKGMVLFIKKESFLSITKVLPTKDSKPKA